MFYSHEILTSRKYGVATVWLVATLGAKSNTKKLTRKAILNVDVQKACDTIMEPEAPMALRLQSNLLYGVSRVYDQQCYYVLQDAQIAQVAMRTLMRATRGNQLDIDAGKARPDQLMIMDDPAFLPENALPALDFDLTNLNVHQGDTQRSSQSMLSVRHRSGSVVSQNGSMLGLDIQYSSGNGNYGLPFGSIGHSSGQKPFEGIGLGGDVFEEEPMRYEEDFIFDFDDEGQLRDIPEDEAEALRAGSIRPHVRMSDTAASERVRNEHQEGRAAHAFNGEDNFNIDFGDDNMDFLPDAEPFPMMTGGLGGNDKSLIYDLDDRVLSEEPSSVSVVAAQAQKRKRARKIKNIASDEVLGLTVSELKAMGDFYLDEMEKTKTVKIHHKSVLQAKKNAIHWIYGTGINGVGEGIGSTKLVGPLAMFSGEALMSWATNSSAQPKAKRGAKRSAEEGEEEDGNSTPSKRLRESELGRAVSQQINYEDDNVMIFGDDNHHSHSQSIEVGRDAASALPDYPSSALMPWNVSASLHSRHRGVSSSLKGGPAGVLGSAARRLASASPLVGRGSNLPGDLEQFSLLHERDPSVMYGRDDGFDGLVGDADFGERESSAHYGGLPQHSDSIHHSQFPFNVVAANVDTQTTATSQWVRDALDKESNNFFDYVKNTIDEKTRDELADDFNDVDAEKHVTFEELFQEQRHTKIVAAQAFYHVLCLATKNRVWADQDVGEEEVPMPWGDIRIGVY